MLWAFLCAQQLAGAQQPTDPAAELDKLRLEMAALQNRIEQDLQLKDETSAQLAKIEQDLNALRRTIRANERSRLDLQGNQAKLQTQLIELRTNAEEIMSELGLLLLRGYPIREHSTLELLLNQENPQRTARLLAYHQILTQSSLAVLEDLSAQIAKINETENQLANRSRALELLIVEQEQDEMAAVALVKQRQSTLAQISQEIEQSNSALERKQRDEARLAEILESAEQQSLAELTVDEPPNILAQKGQLPMPVVGVMQQRYGQHREGGYVSRGWVIETKENAPVHAVASGRVVYSNWLRGYGLLLIIDHQDQILSLYAQNDTLFFEVGDWVRQGEQIASAGQQRPASQTPTYGVYFEIRENGKPTDPAAWLDPSRGP